MKTINLIYCALSGVFLAGCASSVVELRPISEAEKLRIERSSYKTYFCATGSKSNLGGMARMPEAEQFAIGKCKPLLLDRSKLVVIYFGDDSEDDLLPEKLLDAYLNPGDYTDVQDSNTPADSETKDSYACTPGQDCHGGDGLLASGSLVFFNTDSDAPLNVAELHRIARMYKSKPFKISIVGHADSTHTDAHNMHLSVKRAKRVKEVLISLGVEESYLSINGKSSSQPIDNNNTPEGRANNRRAEIKGVDDGH